MELIHVDRTINRKRYSTETATLLADDVYWDGHNHERGGTNTWLFRTPGGRYFLRTQSLWQGVRNDLIPLTPEEAEEEWERLPEKYKAFETAFPHLTVEDA
ncbi:hypothetical protein [Deinococcus aerophilus]|uniref:Uncharacterized protein n=1 Tax=Deinococcus aerophilus TaxID=522488 RepID=A0ABQ2H0M1_9DEIO|nr:hypothetical protein [Deinococcus aerophilus]GGM20225.1 hypothetical protein GCM10010841_30330 [Deinococcus aerophilus]